MRKYCTPEERKWQNYGKKDEDISKKIIGYFRFTDTFAFDEFMNVTTKFLPGWNALGRPFEILRGEKAQIIGAWTCLTHSTILRFFCMAVSLEPVFISAKQLSWDQICLLYFCLCVFYLLTTAVRHTQNVSDNQLSWRDGSANSHHCHTQYKPHTVSQWRKVKHCHTQYKPHGGENPTVWHSMCHSAV